MDERAPILRPSALRHVRGVWAARLWRHTRPFFRLPIGGWCRGTLARAWRGRLDLPLTRPWLRLLRRPRPIARQQFIRFNSSFTTQHRRAFHSHLLQSRLQVRQLQVDGRHFGWIGGTTRVEHATPGRPNVPARLTSRTIFRTAPAPSNRPATEAGRSLATEHRRLESSRMLSTVISREFITAPAVSRPESLAMVLRTASSADRPPPGQFQEPASVLAPMPAAAQPVAPKAEVDVERLTDQVLWRIERRVIAQRERLGKI